jgi:hypothetical protein
MPEQHATGTAAYESICNTPEYSPAVHINLDRTPHMAFPRPAAALPPIWLLLLLPLLPIIPVLLVIQLATAGSGEQGVGKSMFFVMLLQPCCLHS